MNTINTKYSPIWRPFTQMKDLPPLPFVKKAKGEKLFLEDGRIIIDAISSWWVITHGHCEESIVEAVVEQAKSLDQTLFANTTHESGERLIQELSSLLPKSLSHFFFSDNGSTAVEVALKMALQACAIRGEEKRKRFLSFQYGYHGDTVGAMSVGGESSFTAPYKSMLFDAVRIDQAKFSYESSAAYTKAFLDVFETLHQETAAIIIEPLVQGAGGMIMWPEESVRTIVKTAQKAGVYVIFDEVMTGFGRTGELFALEKLNLEPDFLCLSKGITGGILPLALTIAKSHVYETFLSSNKEKMFFHGHSFTGNPISCAAAWANMKLLKKGDWKKNVDRISKIHRERLENVKLKHRLKDLRSCGSIAALEIDVEDEGYGAAIGNRIQRNSWEKGVFLRPLGNVSYLLPPYCISSENLHYVWDVLESSLEEALR